MPKFLETVLDFKLIEGVPLHLYNSPGPGKALQWLFRHELLESINVHGHEAVFVDKVNPSQNPLLLCRVKGIYGH